MATEFGNRNGPLDGEFQTIQLLSLNQIEQKIDIQKEGLKDGHKNHPEIETVNWSLCEKQILQIAEQHVEYLRNLAHEDKVLSQNDLEQMYQSSVSNELRQIEQNAKQNFEKEFVLIKSELRELQEEELRQLRNLNYFKETNKLVRDAVYPTSHFLHFGVLSLFFLAECIGNMYFFAEGSDIGYLGGFFQAALVSTVNVGVSYIVGLFGFTQLSHDNIFRKIAGGMVAIIYAVIIVLFHLAVAHYRDLLVTEPDSAMYLAIDKLRNDILGLNSLDSILVLFLGLAIAIIALYEGYKHDDPYPGFGAKDRRYKSARAANKGKEGELQSSLVAILDNAKNKVGDLLDERERIVITFHKYCELLDVKFGRYQDAIINAEKVTNIAIDKYRKNNQKIRTDEVPVYFSDKSDFFKDYLLPEGFFDKGKYIKKGEIIKDNQETYISDSDNVAEQLLGTVETIEQRVNKLVATVSKEARKTLDSERKEIH